MTNINMNGPPYGAPGAPPYSNGHPMPIPPPIQSNGSAIPSMNGPPYSAPVPPYSNGANGHATSMPQHAQSHGAYNGQQPPPGNPTYGPVYSQNPPSGPPPEMPQMAPAPNNYTNLAPGTIVKPNEPPVRCLVENGKRFELKVMQQPIRARMCGFGDKDRRPITPPPCVRLIVTDVATGKEVDCNDIDHGMYVVLVDLWSHDGSREVNMVRHSATSPSISNTVPVSYQSVTSSNTAYSSVLPQAGILKFEPAPPAHPSSYNPYPGPPQVNAYASSSSQGQQPYYQGGYAPPTNGSQSYPQQNGYSQPPQNGYSQPPPQNGYYGGGGPSSNVEYPPAPQLPSHQYEPVASQGYNAPEPAPQHGSISSASPQGMYTRNLIGSLSVSAFRLTDPDDRIGIWFVLQDLSVRTEGKFRLRFSYVNIGLPVLPNGQGGPSTSSMTVNTGTVPVLASCFSEPFDVFSAKRFPGVVESTALSKCFATQGIKIPIRKEGPGKLDKDKEYEDD